MERITNYKRILVTDIPLQVTLPADKVGRYNARIHDIGEKFFDISCPTAGSTFISVNNNVELNLTISGCGGYYSFTSKVLEHSGFKYPLLKMALPAYIEKCERREFFRLDVMKKVKVYQASLSIKGDEVDVFPDSLLMECICAEIGGGGARLICKQPLPEGTMVGLDISLIIKNFNIVKCLVVRSNERLDKMTDVGLKFIQMRSAERDAIVKSCNNTQIERRNLLSSVKR